MLMLFAFTPTAQAGTVITPGQCGTMDLVFIIDTSGSMSGELTNIKAGLPTIIAEAQLASTSLRVGVISFDGGVANPYGGPAIGPDFVDVKLPLSSNVPDWTTAIMSLTLGNGNSFPEASDQAKETAIFNRVGSMAGTLYADANGVMGPVIADPVLAPTGFTTAWAGTTNIAILVTDATSGGFDDTYSGGDSAHVQALGTAAANHVPPIRMSDIFTGNNAAAITDLTADAVNSGGIFLQIASDGTGIEGAIMDIIAECGGEIPEAIGGEILPVSSTSLLIAGAGANAALLIPMIAGIIGAGAYFTRSYWNKSEE